MLFLLVARLLLLLSCVSVEAVVRLCCLLLLSVVCGFQRSHCCVVCVCFYVLCVCLCWLCVVCFRVVLVVCVLLCRAAVFVVFAVSV